MLIGLDVGGTNTDAVLISKEGKYIKGLKVPTTHEAIIKGILLALEKLLEGVDTKEIERLCVSSTLALNALLTGKADPVGLLLVSGPGLAPPKNWKNNKLVKYLKGAQDHLGVVTAQPDKDEALTALKELKKEGAKALGIVVKFSPKNPELEIKLKDLAQKIFPDDPIVIGSKVSSALNFPRRVNSVWCQAALTRINTDFIKNIKNALPELGLSCPLSILKADSGTFSSDQARENPADSIGSGPAASLLGVAASAGTNKDTIMLSIGGTTTDIALMAKGEPLLMREGLSVEGRPTLIRALNTHSIAIGGDSSLAFKKGKVAVGPEREGPALVNKVEDLGKRPPTLTDALCILDLYPSENKKIAEKALSQLMKDNNEARDSLKIMAQEFVDQAMATIKKEVDAVIAMVNAEPVYTIKEIQHTKALAPEIVVLIGGPAPALKESAEKLFKIPALVPENPGLTNALGAALARPTAEADLYADTELGTMNIPSCGIHKKITASYNLEEAVEDLTKALNEVQEKQRTLKDLEPSPIQILYGETFHTLSNSGRRGKIIRARAQITPGLL